MKKDIGKAYNDNGKGQLKRLFLWVIITALICAILAVATLMYYFAPRDTDTYITTVPAFVGLLESEVNADGDIDIRREWIYSDSVQYGEVISQSPYAGARRKVREGGVCQVTVYISLGQRTEEIPDLCGVDQLSAAAALRSLGARIRSVAVYGDGEDGAVLSTSPSVGCRIKAGDTVTIFVSRKRVTAPVSVPSFIGMSLVDATASYWVKAYPRELW